MAIQFSLAELKNPLRPEDAPKFYAKAQVHKEKDLDFMAKKIAFVTSLSEGEVLSVLRMVPMLIKESLLEGDSVSLGSFGKFQYQISSKGAETQEEFNHTYIVRANVRFRPGKMLKEARENMEFERVLSVRNRRLAEKAEREALDKKG